MDDSDLKTQKGDGAVRDDHHSTVARAMGSFAIFGAIGTAFGAWLGQRANAPGTEMARPILKWGMGVFWAVVAAYSSLKASERVANESRPSASDRDNGSAARDYATVEQMVHNDASPATHVQKATAVAQGLVKENTPQLVSQK
jgi:hypothetical protein